MYVKNKYEDQEEYESDKRKNDSMSVQWCLTGKKGISFWLDYVLFISQEPTLCY